MTPEEFIKKWKKSKLKERSASQSHFDDLCRLLGEETPSQADPDGTHFTFEKGASKTSGGNGWADVWKKECFAWEYKGKHANLDKALHQLKNYAAALDNPPLLIVCDMEHFRIHTNWTNMVEEVHEFKLDDLLDADVRNKLKYAFTNPDQLKPLMSRHALTEEAAQNFATLARTLREQGHDSETVARFINKMVFCMFAEDVQLLPDHIFTNMLDESKKKPKDFVKNATLLFKAMEKGKRVGFKKIDLFNGGMFADPTVLPMDSDSLKLAHETALMDWSNIDPAIMGTLFERGLDPNKRSQLGAHYTDQDKIMQLINPVIKEPLLLEWSLIYTKIKNFMKIAIDHEDKGQRTKARNKAVKLHSAFIERLKNFKVLDPACGSGNFLYLALITLKDLEHKVNLEAEAEGLDKGFPTIGPESVYGIELSSFATELARVSVWVGEIQWMLRHGFEANRNPILKPLNNIQNRDAILAPDGTIASWPDADVVVGNPPFIGNKKMIRELGETYVVNLRKAYENRLSGGVDLVVYWFDRAWAQIEAGTLNRAGLVATNSIRSTANKVILERITDGGEITNSYSDEEWVNNGASVRVSLVCFSAQVMGNNIPYLLNGIHVSGISANLTPKESSIAKRKRLIENKGVSFTGVFLNGAFEVSAKQATTWLLSPKNVNGMSNAAVLKRSMNGEDLLQKGEDKWIIDFGCEIEEQEAAFFELPFCHIDTNVKPFRQRKKKDGSFEVRRLNHRNIWWRYAECRPGMRNAIEPLTRYLVTPMVSSTRVFVFLHKGYLANQKLVVFAKDDDTFFGIMQSNIHYLWTLETCSWIGAGNDPSYATTSVFDTFPFPKGLTPNIPAADYAANPHAIAIAQAAKNLDDLRNNWLNPSDLVKIKPEVVAGYPDRILPVDAKAAEILKKRTLTNLYNNRPAWLDNAHKTLDTAVAAAYGWPDDLSEEQIIEKLFALNQERAKKQEQSS